MYGLRAFSCLPYPWFLQTKQVELLMRDCTLLEDKVAEEEGRVTALEEEVRCGKEAADSKAREAEEARAAQEARVQDLSARLAAAQEEAEAHRVEAEVRGREGEDARGEAARLEGERNVQARELEETKAGLMEREARIRALEEEMAIKIEEQQGVLASREEEVRGLREAERGAREWREALDRRQEEERRMMKEEQAVAEARLQEVVRAHAACAERMRGLESTKSETMAARDALASDVARLETELATERMKTGTEQVVGKALASEMAGHLAAPDDIKPDESGPFDMGLHASDHQEVANLRSQVGGWCRHK